MNSTQVAKVIEAFEKVLKEYPAGRLDMLQTSVNSHYHECGTVHCHGGWYAVGRLDLSKRMSVNFTHGAHQLAKDLGFSERFLLTDWAEHNPYVWGNILGGEMFVAEWSFTPGDKDRALNLQDIIDHWYEVHDRLWLSEQL